MPMKHIDQAVLFVEEKERQCSLNPNNSAEYAEPKKQTLKCILEIVRLIS